MPSAPGETHFKATNRLLKVFLFVFSASVLLPVTHAAHANLCGPSKARVFSFGDYRKIITFQRSPTFHSFNGKIELIDWSRQFMVDCVICTGLYEQSITGEGGEKAVLKAQIGQRKPIENTVWLLHLLQAHKAEVLRRNAAN